MAVSCGADEGWEMLLHPSTCQRMTESRAPAVPAALGWQQSAVPALLGAAPAWAALQFLPGEGKSRGKGNSERSEHNPGKRRRKWS